MTRATRALALVALVLAAAAALAQGLKLGVLVDRRASASVPAASTAQGVALAAKQVNDDGGLLLRNESAPGHVDRRVLELVTANITDAQSPADALAALLAEPGLDVVFGADPDPEALAALEASPGAVLWTPDNSAGEACHPQVARVGTLPEHRLVPAIKWAMSSGKAGHESPRFAWVGPSDAATAQKRQVAERFLAVHGFDLDAEVLENDADSTAAEAVRDSLAATQHGGLVICAASGAGQANFFTSVLGDAAWTVLSLTLDSPDSRGETGHLAAYLGHYTVAGTVTALTTLNGLPGVDVSDSVEFIAAYHAEYAAYPDDQAAAAYSAVRLWLSSARHTGLVDAASTLAAARTGAVVAQTPLGSAALGPHHQASRQGVLSQINNYGGLLPQGLVPLAYTGMAMHGPYSQWLNATHLHGCSWLPGGGGERFTLETVPFGIAADVRGPNAQTERELVATILAASAYVNQYSGGISGRLTLPIVVDASASSHADAAAALWAGTAVPGAAAVEAVFGGYRAADRVGMEAAAEAAGEQAVLFTAGASPGWECPRQAVHTGALPEQLAVPALEWAAVSKLRGADTAAVVVGPALGAADSYERKLQELVADRLEAFGVTVAGLFDSDDVAAAAASVASAVGGGGYASGVIVSLYNGGADTVALWNETSAVGGGPASFPVLSVRGGLRGGDLLEYAHSAGVRALSEHQLVATWYAGAEETDPYSVSFLAGYQSVHGSGTRPGDDYEAAAVSYLLWVDAEHGRGEGTLLNALESRTAPVWAPAGGSVRYDPGSRYLERRGVVVRFDGTGAAPSVVHQPPAATTAGKPRPWPDLLTVSRASAESYSCDWSPAHASGRFADDQVERVGILHSLEGALGASERPLVATLLRLVTLRNLGLNWDGTQLPGGAGLNGKRLLPVVANGASDDATFAAQARLLNGTAAVFGCWTSSSRVVVRGALAGERLLFYPVQYEGQECDSHVFYGGQTPQQQLVPALEWSLRRGETTFVLAASDYLYPRTANHVAASLLARRGATIAATEYVPLGGTDVDAIVDAIDAAQALRADGRVTVVNTLNGNTNEALFTALGARGLTADTSGVTVVSMSVGEAELATLPPAGVNNSYAAWSYFRSLDTPQNTKFLGALEDAYGPDGRLLASDPSEAHAVMFEMWGRAVTAAGTVETEAVRRAMYGVGVSAPQGQLTMGANHHMDKTFALGRASGDTLGFDVEWQGASRQAMPWSPFLVGGEDAAALDADPTLRAYGVALADTSVALYQCDWSPAQRDGGSGKFEARAVRVGVLHSFGGAVASSERPVADATLLAVRRLNERGGVRGHQVVPVVRDGNSDPAQFATVLGDMLEHGRTVRDNGTDHALPEPPSAVFGLWTSSSRQAVLPVLGEHTGEAMLFYSVQHEGQECSREVMYGGATPNQQLIPALEYVVDRLVTGGLPMRVVLVGSDYVYPRTANNITQAYLEARGVNVVLVPYVELGATGAAVTAAADLTALSLPGGGFVINTLNGEETNKEYFTALWQTVASYHEVATDAEVRARWLVMSTSITEHEVQGMGAALMEGTYVAANYFHTVPGDDNDAFKAELASGLGGNAVANDPMATAWAAVELWAAAAEAADSFENEAVRQALLEVSAPSSPLGPVSYDANQHMRKRVYIGRANAEGLFDVVRSRLTPVAARTWSDELAATFDPPAYHYCDWYAASGAGAQISERAVNVGVLHSFNGPLAISEVSLVKAVTLAVEEINDAGGLTVGGRPYRVVPRVKDSESNATVAADRLGELALSATSTNGVTTIFGGWTSASRQAMVPVIENSRALLYYAVQYEGQESSRSVFYSGATPTQQLLPALEFATHHLGLTFALIGSDYVYPRTANNITRAFLAERGCTVAWEGYLPLDASAEATAALTDEMLLAVPDGTVVLNTLNGDTNVAFFHALTSRGRTPETLPVVSTSITETELDAIGASHTAGHYAAWNYYEDLDTPGSAAFVAALRARFGDEVRATDPMNSAYTNVRLWALAAEAGGLLTASAVRDHMYGLEFDAPEGRVTVEGSHHLTKNVRVLRAAERDGRGVFERVSGLPWPLPARPWSDYMPGAPFVADWQADPVAGGQVPETVVRVGIVRSLTGDLSTSERAVLDADLLAIEEVNQNGGVLGRRVLPTVLDGASDADTFAARAGDLLDRNITTLFAGWTSTSREAMRAVLDARDEGVLYYPLQYEGEQCSGRIFAGGQVPNQQLVPPLQWVLENVLQPAGLPLAVALVGSNYTFPRTANAIASAYLANAGVQVAGEWYFELGAVSVGDLASGLAAALPEGGLVLSTLNGEAVNRAFFQALKEANMRPQKWPSLSLSIGEPEVRALGAELVAGHHAAWSYFHPAPGSQDAGAVSFAARMAAVYGENTLTSDPSAAAYALVRMWAQAAEAAGTVEPDAVADAMPGVEFDAPEGAVRMASNHHLTKHVRVGTVRAEDGLFDVAFSLGAARYPQPWSPLLQENEETSATCSWGPNCTDALEEAGACGERVEKPAVRVGVLHSLTGALALSETGVSRITAAALERINQEHGGVLGRRIVPLVRDGRSDAAEFAARARGLVEDDGASFVFGGWTSDSRKAMKPVVEGANALLMYSVQYEGNECSRNIFYGGAPPNLQLEPALRYVAYRRPEAPWFLLGSNYVFPWTANNITADVLSEAGAEVAGTRYVPLAVPDAEEAARQAVDAIVAAMPEGGVVLNTLNGEVNVNLFRELSRRNLTADTYLTLSMSAGEAEFHEVVSDGVTDPSGHLASWNYLQTADTEANREFLAWYRTVEGPDALVTDPMEAAWIWVQAWHQAVERAGTFDVDAVREHMYGVEVDAPEGRVRVLPNHHLAKVVRLGRVRADGLLDEVLAEPSARRGNPYSQQWSDTRGLACDWSDPAARGARYEADSVQVGVLTSKVGVMAQSERDVLDAILFAIEEVNEDGGALYHEVLPIVADTASTANGASAAAAHLLAGGADAAGFEASPVRHLFGLWTSAARKAALPVLDGTPDARLYYPLQFEANEAHPQVFYGGATPRQQLEPALDYMVRGLGVRKFALLGSDYVFPRTANAIAANYLEAFGAEAAVTRYVPLDATDAEVEAMVDATLDALPDGGGILSTVNGASNAHFFRHMRARGMTPERWPVMSLSVGESEVALVGAENLAGHYASWSFFSTLQDDGAREFVSNFRKRFGADRLVSDPMEAAYTLVHMWNRAVTLARSFEAADVSRAMRNSVWGAPSAVVRVDHCNFLEKPARVGRALPDGSFEVVSNQPRGLPAQPWNPYLDAPADRRLHTCSHAEGGGGSRFPVARQVAVGLMATLSGDDASGADLDALHGQLLALDELNELGGTVGGASVLPIVLDSRSSAELRGQQTADLLKRGDVAAVFQGGGSRAMLGATRDAVAAASRALRGDNLAPTAEPANPGASVWESESFPAADASTACGSQSISVVGTAGASYRTALAWAGENLGVSRVVLLLDDNDRGTALEAAASRADSPVAALEDAAVRFGADLAPGGTRWHELLDAGLARARAHVAATKPRSVLILVALLGSDGPAAVRARMEHHGMAVLDYPVLMLEPDGRVLERAESVSGFLCASTFFASDDRTPEASVYGDLLTTQAGFAVPVSAASARGFRAVDRWASAAEAAASLDAQRVRLMAYTNPTSGLSSPGAASPLDESNDPLQRLFLAEVTTFGGNVHVIDEAAAAPHPAAVGGECAFGEAKVVLQYSSAAKVVAYTFTAVNYALLALAVTLTYLARNAPSIKSASVPFCFLILVSLGVLSAAGHLFAVEPSPDTGVCQGRMWTTVTGLTCVFAFLFAKTARLAVIFRRKKLQKVQLTNASLVLRVLPVLAVQLLLATTWQAVDQPRYEEDLDEAQTRPDLEVVVIPGCHTNNVFLGLVSAYMSVILVAAAGVAWSIRRIPQNFNEAPQIMASLFFVLAYCVILFPLNYLVTSPDALVLIRSVGVQFGVAVVGLALFAPKFLNPDVASILSSLKNTSTKHSKRASGGGSRQRSPRETRYTSGGTRSPVSKYQGASTIGPAGIEQRQVLRTVKRQLAAARHLLARARDHGDPIPPTLPGDKSPAPSPRGSRASPRGSLASPRSSVGSVGVLELATLGPASSRRGSPKLSPRRMAAQSGRRSSIASDCSAPETGSLSPGSRRRTVNFSAEPGSPGARASTASVTSSKRWSGDTASTACTSLDLETAMLAAGTNRGSSSEPASPVLEGRPRSVSVPSPGPVSQDSSCESLHSAVSTKEETVIGRPPTMDGPDVAPQ